MSSKPLQNLKSGFARTINWSRYQSKPKNTNSKHVLIFFINPSFQGVNILFLLLFEDEPPKRSHKRYFLPTAELKD